MDVIKVDPFDSVAASSIATARYRPVGPSSLFGFLFKLGGTFVLGTHVNGITIKAPGGKELVPDISGARLQDLYEFEGLVNDTGFVPYLFGDPTARTLRGMHLGNFDHTVYPGDLTIEVDIGAATTPTLEAFALVAPPKLAMNLGFTAGEASVCRALIESVISISAAVTRQAISPSFPTGSMLKRLALFHANLTELDVKKDGLQVYEDVPDALASYMQDDLFARVPQSGLHVYERIIDGSYSEAGRTARSDGSPSNWLFRATTSAADTLTAYADVLAPLAIL